MNVHPGPDALVNAQDKLVMRAAIDRLELPNPRWAAVDDVAELVAFGEDTGWPVVLKTPRGGYDGKGVRIVDSAEDAADSADWFEAMSPLLAEAKVEFSRELSALVARTPDGESRAWPVVHTDPGRRRLRRSHRPGPGHPARGRCRGRETPPSGSPANSALPV